MQAQSRLKIEESESRDKENSRIGSIKIKNCFQIITINRKVMIMASNLVQSNQQLFKQTSAESLDSLEDHEEILMASQLCIDKNGMMEIVSAKLTKCFFSIQQQSGSQHKLAVNFSIKFQVMFESENDVKSKKIGFRIFHQQTQQSLIFYSKDQTLLQKWIQIFRKHINQYGFHQNFKAIRKLGKGQFATVFQVQSIQTGAKYAVKAFSKASLIKAPKGMESLINQIKIMRSFCHRNLQKLECVYESSNSIYVVTQLLKGGTLFERIQQLFRESPINKLEQIKQFIYGLLSGLHQLKQLRIVHRDLKLDNIMLRSQKGFDPVIIDFGLGTFCDEKEYIYYRCGTPGYVSPQVMSSTKTKKIQPESDMFSAGAIFYHLLTEKSLFEGKSADEVLLKNKNFTFDLNNKNLEKLDSEAVALLTKMLEINSQKRISVTEAMMDDFLVSGMKNDSPVSTILGEQDRQLSEILDF